MILRAIKRNHPVRAEDNRLHEKERGCHAVNGSPDFHFRESVHLSKLPIINSNAASLCTNESTPSDAMI